MFGFSLFAILPALYRPRTKLIMGLIKTVRSYDVSIFKELEFDYPGNGQTNIL